MKIFKRKEKLTENDNTKLFSLSKEKTIHASARLEIKCKKLFEIWNFMLRYFSKIKINSYFFYE
ncbi:hypothetical protein [Spiroplasma sp. AdecLV25b]|uniref:hypothetical protein n=1 Tax=Spiroplasma sp. AdecLV25b TaxID=3027162 RepID=UPI0027E10299|nr:hypothetical protein [Spiroplasma sp. AdecLV25b]